MEILPFILGPPLCECLFTYTVSVWHNTTTAHKGLSSIFEHREGKEMESQNAYEKDLLTANDLIARGFNRSLAYKLLNRADLPVVRLNGRVYMHRKRFEAWLDEQSKSGGAA